MHKAFCRIIPLDRYNWELSLKIRLSPIQEEFTPSVLYSLAQAKFEDLSPYGILYGDDMVGFIMYGEFGGICWISRIMIDEHYQRMGIGKSAMRQLLEMLGKNIRCKEIRTSFSIRNTIAKEFFTSLGFKIIDEPIGEEVVAQYDSSLVY